MIILLQQVIQWPFKDSRVNILETFLLTALVAIATINLTQTILVSAGVEAKGVNYSHLRTMEWIQ